MTGPASQRHRLALLALLALAPDRTLPRDKLFALLWPDADTASARHLLNTCVHVIRRATHDDLLTSRRDELTLSRDVAIDVLDFLSELNADQPERAIALYTSPLLDAFFLDDAVEFEQWIARERSRLANLFRDALETLADRAESSGDTTVAVKWWRNLNREDPYNTRVVMRLMLALERAGDHGNAIEFAIEHESLLARDMEAEAPAEFRALIKRMRDQPNGIAERSISGRVSATAGQSASVPLPDGTGNIRQHETPGVTSAALGHASSRRVKRWAAGFVAAAALAAFLVLTPSPFSTSTVLIGDFANLTGDPALNTTGSELRDLVIRDASQWSRVQVVLPEAAEASSALLPRLVRQVQAGTLIEGTYSKTADSIRFDARLIDRRNNRVLRVASINLPAGRFPVGAMQSFSEHVMGALAMIVDERFAAVSSADHTAPRFRAYQEFAVGLELHGNADHTPAVERFRRAVAADSTFTLAAIWLGRALDKSALFRSADSLARALQARPAPLPNADRLAVEWLLARYRGDAQAAYRTSRALAEITPGSPWVLTYASEAANLRRPQEALEALVGLEQRSTWIASWSEFVSNKGYALHLLRRYEEEYALARRNRHLATNLIVRLIAEARPLAAMGRVDEIDRIVGEALATAEQPNLNEGSLMQRVGLELGAHGHGAAAQAILRRGRSWYEAELREGDRTPMFGWALANTLLGLGEVDAARTIYEQLHQRSPRMYRFQGDLSIAAARAHRLTEVAHFDSLLATPDSTLNNFDSSLRVLYRARTAALIGDKERALQLLQAAVAQGVPVALDSVHIDRDLHGLRGMPVFDELTRLKR